MDMITSIGTYLKGIATEAIIRSGDYPRNKGIMEVTVILSELTNVDKIMNYFTTTSNFIYAAKSRWDGTEYERKSTEDIFKDIPSLL